MCDSEIFEDFVIERGLRERTAREYKYVMKAYCRFNNMSLSQLLNEADEEELQGKRWKDRKLRKRLIRYRSHLHNDKRLSESSVKKHFTNIRTFYSHHEIELGKLPKYSTRNVKRSKPLTAEDIPSVELVRKAVELAPSKDLAMIIHFMSATGLARVDAMNLNVSDYIKATEKHHQSNKLQEMLQELSECNDAIGEFNLMRSKTEKWHYTFCTTEVVNRLAKYLMSRKKLKMNSQLFNLKKTKFYTQMWELNQILGFEKDEDGKWWFRSHKLRKFHSKQLKAGVDGMSIDDIDALQGRAKDKTYEAYHIVDPKLLREKYVKHMHKLVLFSKVDVRLFESEEYKELKKETELYRKKVSEQEAMIREINKNQEKMRKLLGL